MSSNSVAPRDQQGFKEIIVTLPGWGLWVIAGLCLLSLVLAVGLALLSNSENVKSYAVQLLVVLVPLGVAVIAGIAIRRTSTQQIDHLVTGFLEKTLLERFQIHCNYSSPSHVRIYPFNAVRLLEPCRGTSYVVYELHWRSRSDRAQHAPVRVSVKCNVFNFELFSELPVQIGPNSEPGYPLDWIINAGNVAQFAEHPVLCRFMSVLQGSVNEGYEAHVSFKPRPDQPDTWNMHFSLRQKLGENFLTSPFLKRYLAEDAAIATGVLFQEWLAFQPADAMAAQHH